MEELLQQIASHKQEIISIQPKDETEWESYRIRFLGTKGIVKHLFASMKEVPNDKKKEFGQILNDFKQFAEAKYEGWKSSGATVKGPSVSDIDLSLPGD